MSAVSRHRLGPYSRTLDRGAIGHSIDGRSREGRYLRAIEAEITKHLGDNPTVAQTMLTRRLARVALRLELFDEKITAGALTDHDARTYGALHNSFRLMLRELDLKGATAPKSLTRALAEAAAA